MSDKEAKIECPCCHSELRVDLLTGKLSSWLRAGDSAPAHGADPSQRWDASADRVKGRLAGNEDRLDRELGKERERSQNLDDVFDAAKKRATRRGDQSS
ncbi:MAG: hypothetical protein FJ299_04950 [Planctomycetes bacterium]|nr:hypothetical protein [Planctomycetota bacterium]